MYLSISIYIFILIWSFYYLKVSIKSAKLIGFSKYLRVIIVRDFRIFIGVLYFALTWYLYKSGYLPFIDYAPWIKAILFLPILTVLRGFSPPQILLLHSFKETTFLFGEKLAVSSPINIVSFNPGARFYQKHSFLNFKQTNTGLGARKFSEQEWREAIQVYFDLADTIVVDLTTPQKGLLEEISFLSDKKEIWYKLVFICIRDLAAQDGIKYIKEKTNHDFPCYEYISYLSGRTFLLFSNVNDKLALAIRSRIYSTPPSDLYVLVIILGLIIDLWQGTIL